MQILFIWKEIRCHIRNIEINGPFFTDPNTLERQKGFFCDKILHELCRQSKIHAFSRTNTVEKSAVLSNGCKTRADPNYSNFYIESEIPS